MANRSIILYSVYSIILASSLGLTTSVPGAFAINGGQAVQTKTGGDDRQGHDFANGTKVNITDGGTKWNRKTDAEKKAEADADNQKRAVEAQKQARQAQIDAYKQIQQMAADSNNQAVNFGKQGRWPEAITAHEKACRYDPTNKQYRINLSAARTAYGQLLLSKGNNSEACSLFRKAITAAPDNGLAVRELLAALKKAGYDPSNATTRIKLGDQLKETGDLEGASVEYTAALQLDPSARTYVKLGDFAYSVNQVQQAANYYRMAISKDPDCAAAHRQIGFLELATGDQTSAAASLRKALILDSTDGAAGTALVELWRKQVAANPSSAEHHLGLATALQLTNDFSGAESEYRTVESIEPNNPGLALGRSTLAKAYAHAKADKMKMAAQKLYENGLKKEALAEIAQAVRLEPRNATYQFMLGECLESVGDYKDAHQAYLFCVLIDPEHNAEAAARAKKMESQGNATPEQIKQQAEKASEALSRQYSQPAIAAAPQAQAPAGGSVPFSNGAPPQFNQAAAPTPSMFEGGQGAPSVPNSQLSFRTHDESPEAQVAAQSQMSQQQMGYAPQAAQQAMAPQAAPGAMMGGALVKADQAEAARDFTTAVSVLRDAVNNDMKNADLHHRLAGDLQSANELSEAVAEYRIAAALAPNKKEFADDFKRASVEHKKAMTTTSDTASQPEGNRAISGLNDMVGASK
jgi:tetratricopeptide (TPR) repeat protein